MKRLFFGIFLLLTSASTASAIWLYKSEESAFSGRQVHVLATANGKYAFVLRCRDEKVEALFYTPEPRQSEDRLDLLNAAEPELLVRVDSNETFTLGSVIENNGERILQVANTDISLVEQVRGAKKRVAVAMSILGQVLHEQYFSARGSTAEANKLLPNCATDGVPLN